MAAAAAEGGGGAGGAGGAGTAPQICVPWAKLLTWVQQQIALEMQTGRPVALSRPQLEAVSQLVSFNDEPDVGDRDYVSLLLQSTQSRRLSAPVFANPEPLHMPVDGHFEPRWQCTCTIQSIGTFPRPGHGMSVTQAAPWFQSKKNAKQYAAKQALDYLSQIPDTSKPPPPSVLDKRPLPPPSSPQQKSSRPRWEPPSPAVASSASTPAPPPFTASAPLPSAAETTARARQPSVFEQVACLTGRLGIDSPSYRVWPDPAGADLFCGRPVFKNGGHVPADLGVVSGVEGGQAQAKVRIAEKVLAWAEAELRKRQEIFHSLWGSAAALEGTNVTG
ncbi:hypothetical protein E4U41_002145 [Claviceps citrina]|nr:hypothetical protein E4U41_002145 [Claviceps citrina]